MTLKYTVDSLDGIDDALKPLYQKDGDKYVLAVDGIPKEDVSGLKRQVETLLGEKKAAAERAKAAEEAAAAAAEEAARKAGDTKAIEESWQKKLAKAEAEAKAKIESLTGMVTKLTSGQMATRLAAELALPGHADVLLPHISARLRTDYEDGGAKLVILDRDGKPSAMSVDELREEFVSNKAFAPLLAGSKASGGGAEGQNAGGAGVRKVSRTAFDAMTPAQKSALAKEGATIVDD